MMTLTIMEKVMMDILLVIIVTILTQVARLILVCRLLQLHMHMVQMILLLCTVEDIVCILMIKILKVGLLVYGVKWVIVKI